jgi:hypothetical protein
MIFSENRFPLFRIMLTSWWSVILLGKSLPNPDQVLQAIDTSRGEQSPSPHDAGDCGGYRIRYGGAGGNPSFLSSGGSLIPLR